MARTRKYIYEKYIDNIIAKSDLIILDRSYYTSAVWQSESDDEVMKIISNDLLPNINVGVSMQGFLFHDALFASGCS